MVRRDAASRCSAGSDVMHQSRTRTAPGAPRAAGCAVARRRAPWSQFSNGDERMSEDGAPLSARLGSRGPSMSSRIRDMRIEPAIRLVLSRHSPWSATVSCREVER